jgi:hypothetical protein
LARSTFFQCLRAPLHTVNLDVFWHKPFSLEDGDEEDLIFNVNGIERYDGLPGVYIFGRKYGNQFLPLYIGKALNIGSRIRQHLNTTKLMTRIRKASAGQKVLVIGEFKGKSGQKTETAITLIERASMANHALVDLLRTNAERKKATPAQVALAWLLARKPWIVPIPGARKMERLDENIGAVAVELTSDDLSEIDSASSKIKA